MNAVTLRSPPAADRPAFAKTILTIVTATGERAFNVEHARTPRELAHGLMFARSMALDAGMLLDFGTPQRISIWMKNTFIPLDILYIRADGTIESIRAAKPHDQTALPSKGPVRAVLEVNVGVTRLLGIRPGDKVRHKIFGTAQ